jgi:hypothetical protein
MSRWSKGSVVFVTVAALSFTLLASPVLAEHQTSVAPAAVESSSAEAMVFDFLFLRPLGVAATAAGGTFFVISLPFSAMGNNTGQAARKLMVEPAKFTFSRPLGQLE